MSDVSNDVVIFPPCEGPRIVFPYALGDTVKVDGKEAGIVTGYWLTKGSIKIEVAWCANGDAKANWFEDWRVSK